MNGTSIISQLTNRDKERLRGYKDLLDFYQGRQWPGRERWGEKRLTFNYARVFIDKLTSYLMSGINFTVEAIEDSPQARARAEQAEKALYRVYEANNLEQLDLETETDCAVLGDGCYKVTWEEGESGEESGFKNKDCGGRIRVTAPDIRGIYAWWSGDDISRVWKVASKYQLTAEEAETLYPTSTSIPAFAGIQKTTSPDSAFQRNGREVIELWTDNTFEIYLNNTLLESRPNPYGFIPFIIFPNLREPKQFWGTSDLVQVMEPQRELNRAMSQISHILELSGNPVAVLENVEQSTDIAVRPGAVWNIPEDAKAYLLDLLGGGGLQRHIEYIDLLYRALHDISETPRAAFGGLDRDLSGAAMQIELYPLLQKVIRKRIIRNAVYNRRNRMVLQLLEKFGEESGLRIPDSGIPPSGTQNPRLSIFNPGQYRLRTVWGQVLPQDQARLVQNEQILVDSGIHSRRKAMDEVGVKDPEAEFRHWIEEQKEVMNIKNSKS